MDDFTSYRAGNFPPGPYDRDMELQELAAKHEDRFLGAMEELARENRGALAAIGMDCDWGPAQFKKFIKQAEKDRQDWRPKAGKVSLTRYVLMGDGKESDHIRAIALMRFPLDVKTETDGGNLAVAVPPALRSRGYGSYCLALLLFEAVRAGLRRVLVTCPESDGTARRMIEKNRGQLHDLNETKRGKIARYWIAFS